ncbi:response regulator transcription factor [Sediminibacterium roseum]|uniref:Response regulator transcription factor n=1 Tax=Sediminibacterium roseum TaxID=1978412 RepID=A0ABW9ZRB8_9BACT|nr:response regulator transcription factor [Sediminibacterium roseum]NCI49645.1 response regulator transcription factor [Sediminibacterium roseum]
MGQNIRVLIADDHQVYREGLKSIIHRFPGITVSGEAGTGSEAVSFVRDQQPGVVLMDIIMPGMNGIEAARIIRQEFPKTSVIAVSRFTDRIHVIDMIHAGAMGYLSKGCTKKELLDAIYSVSQNIPYYSTEVALILNQLTGHRNFQVNKDGHESGLFTRNELRVIELICQQKTAKEIAETLCLGVRTIEGYRKRIEEKMGVRNTAGIVVYAIRKKIFLLPPE